MSRVVAGSAVAAAAAVAVALWYIRKRSTTAEPAPEPTLRSAYRPSDWTISEAYLDFDLHETCAIVECKLALRRTATTPQPLTLDGEELELLRLAVDGRALTADEYSVGSDGRLTIVASALSESCTLFSEVRVYPQNNSQLSGLYKSGGMFCTQCEAEGFRRITFFLDRPDVMATFRVRVEAEKERYPVLLSNGNKLAEGPTLGGRHFALWEDPFPKPCYLFAVVAGDLGSVHDTHTTPDGRVVAIGFYSEHKNVHKLGHGMHSLKQASSATDRRVAGMPPPRRAQATAWASAAALPSPRQLHPITVSLRRRRVCRRWLGTRPPSASRATSPLSTSWRWRTSTWERWRTRASTSSTPRARRATAAQSCRARPPRKAAMMPPRDRGAPATA